MTEEVDIVWIICAPWTEWQLRALAGNRTSECSACSDPVVISTEGQELARQHPLTSRLICVPCAMRDMPDGVPEAAPGSVERAERAGYALSPRLRAALGRLPLRDYPSQ